MQLKCHFCVILQFLLCRYKLQLFVGNNLALQKSPILSPATLQVIYADCFKNNYLYELYDGTDIFLKNPSGNLRKPYSVTDSVVCVDE